MTENDLPPGAVIFQDLRALADPFQSRREILEFMQLTPRVHGGQAFPWKHRKFEGFMSGLNRTLCWGEFLQEEYLQHCWAALFIYNGQTF